ncbi:glycosyltransferase family 4 protein [Microbacterium atlanticum]|uniref:glycosyltransferase family 4 protein n=1 Tax=Microbacterium atlanticum TaxID=2782168 RepID=UPI001E5AE228|nr:glycosyltransferase family 4 protein [Microbacterium atlanticum]
MPTRKVIIISQLPPPVHGSTVMTETLVRALRDSDIDVIVVSRRFSSNVADIGRFSFSKFFRVPSLLMRVARAHAEAPHAIVVFFVTNRMGSFLVDLLIGEYLRLARVPRIDYVHTVGFLRIAERGRVWRWMVTRLLRGSNQTVCLTETLRADVTWVKPRSAVVIPNAVQDHHPSVTECAGTAKTVIFMSNLLPEKGAQTFIELASELSATAPETSFLIAGSTEDHRELAKLKAMASDSPAAIEFLGHIDRERKNALLASADVLVFPTAYEFEAAPLTLLESFAAGTPVVAYALGGIRDMFLDAVCGEAVDPGDFRALTSATARVLDDRRPRSERRAAIQRVHAEYFSLPAYRAHWARLVDQTVGARNG